MATSDPRTIDFKGLIERFSLQNVGFEWIPKGKVLFDYLASFC